MAARTEIEVNKIKIKRETSTDIKLKKKCLGMTVARKIIDQTGNKVI